MYTHLHEPLSLQEMAELTALSPCHFTRIFASVTGITPGSFFSALRLKSAIRLLLTTELSITQICYEVGYESLGSFTTRFTQLAGLPPTQLRQLTNESPVEVHSLIQQLHYRQRVPGTPLALPALAGHIHADTLPVGPIFIGLFPTPIPQGRPVACTVLAAPGSYRITHIPEGCYYIFAAAFPWSETMMNYLLPDECMLRVGVGEKPMIIRHGQASEGGTIRLRAIVQTDPPILSTLPLLLNEYVDRIFD